MLGHARGFFLGALLLAAGWIVGSLYPAPAAITAPIAARAPNLAARLGIDDVTLDRLSRFMSSDQLVRLRHDASAMAAQAGEAILIERIEGPMEMQAEPIIQVSAGGEGAAAFEDQLTLCPGLTVSNAPAAGANGSVRNYAKLVNVNGVAIATAPTRGACLSSSFGSRNGRLHKGIDLHSNDGGPILAAGDGVVIERKYRDDYGNMLLIDHGDGVYTRYAHLSSFAEGVVTGAHVTAGQRLGLMGNTASYQIPVHLHYELLLGDYDNAAGSFGLTPHSVFEYAAAP